MPDAEFSAEQVITRTLAVGLPALKQTICVAIELSAFDSVRAIYSLVGGCLTPKRGTDLRVEIGVSDTIGHILLDNLALRMDTVRVGLPLEYLPGIHDGLSSLGDIRSKLPAGEFVISRAAHSDIGSNCVMFARATRVLFAVLTVAGQSASIEDLKQLVLSRWDSIRASSDQRS